MGYSWIRDWTSVSCIGRQILCQWASREAPQVPFSTPSLHAFLGELSVFWSDEPGCSELWLESQPHPKSFPSLHLGCSPRRTVRPSGACLAFCVGPFPVPLVLHPDWILIGFMSAWCSCAGGTVPSPALITLCCCFLLFNCISLNWKFPKGKDFLSSVFPATGKAP